MKHLAGLLLLFGCAATPAPLPVPVVITKTVVVTKIVPAPPPTTIPAAAQPVEAVLHDSVVLKAEAARYVGWKDSNLATMNTLAALVHQVNVTTAIMVRSRRHGHYGLVEVRNTTAAVAALSALLANKGD